MGMPAKASKGSAVLPREVVSEFIQARSDVQGFAQLAFHICAGLLCAFAVKNATTWPTFICAELALGFVCAFAFNAFHECIHGSAFKTPFINECLMHVLGFFIFRGARWYYYFHWAHHRFTNDPKYDPELSGSTTDRADPLSIGGWQGLKSYLIFMSG
jgi:fatty acid desaturase